MEPKREDVDRMPGPVVLEFGADWCPHCQALRPVLAEALAGHPAVRHIAVEDGKGRPLGRSFGVKLWPTLVFLKGGTVVSQLVRPTPGEVAAGFAGLVAEG